MDDADTSLIARLRRFDESRAGVPGEHWLAFTLGLYLLVRSRETVLGCLASRALGAAFVARALSGRGGALALLRSKAQGEGDDDFVEVAAPWPYDERVRIAPRKTADSK